MHVFLKLDDSQCGLPLARRYEHYGVAKRGRGFTFMARYLFCSLFLFSSLCLAGLNEDIKITIEEPVRGGVYSGISNLRGWAISPEGMGSYYLDVYVDGEFAFYMYPYGQRPDVGNAYPDYPGSETGGFSMAFNYKDLSPGEHEIRVRAWDNANDYNEAVRTFTTERFVGPFISDDSDVDISTSETWTIVDNQTYLITGPTIEGKKWDFQLKWDKASQSFKILQIEPADSGDSGGQDAACDDIQGIWSGYVSGEQSVSGGGYYVTDSYYLRRGYRIEQSGCSLTITINSPDYLPMSGTISASSVSVSGQPIDQDVFERGLEDYLYQNGIIGSVNAQSITLTGQGSVNDTRIFLEYAIRARGYVSTSQGNISFEYRDDGSGDIYK